MTALEAGRRGFHAAPAPERAALGMSSAFAVTIGIARIVNYVREQRRPAPAARSRLRQVAQRRRPADIRVHHFLPGIAVAFAAGGTAIIARDDGREFWLSLPFGTGIALTFDELALLVSHKKAYFGSETLALGQGVAASGLALGLVLRLQRRGERLHEGSPVDGPIPAARSRPDASDDSGAGMTTTLSETGADTAA